MNGARQLACDYLTAIVKNGAKILDVCCGDGWVKRQFPMTDWAGLDKKESVDILKPIAPHFTGWPDLILSIYGLQHLLGEEAEAWVKLRRIARPDTRFVVVGSYESPPCRWLDRADPLNRHDAASITGLAFASGWRVVELKLAQYEGDFYSWNLRPANAFASTMEPI